MPILFPPPSRLLVTAFLLTTFTASLRGAPQVNSLHESIGTGMALRVTADRENESLGNENESLRLPEPVCSCCFWPCAQHYVKSKTTIEGCIGHTNEKYNTLVVCDWPGSRLIVCRFRAT
jgi:hypothetical protein